MITIKFDVWQVIVLKALLSVLCDERRKQIDDTKSMRRFYTKQELSDKELDVWVAAAQHRLDEAVELLKLFELAYERA